MPAKLSSLFNTERSGAVVCQTAACVASTEFSFGDKAQVFGTGYQILVVLFDLGVCRVFHALDSIENVCWRFDGREWVSLFRCAVAPSEVSCLCCYYEFLFLLLNCVLTDVDVLLGRPESSL